MNRNLPLLTLPAAKWSLVLCLLFYVFYVFFVCLTSQFLLPVKLFNIGGNTNANRFTDLHLKQIHQISLYTSHLLVSYDQSLGG